MTERTRTVTPVFDPLTGPLVPVTANGTEWVVVVAHGAAVSRWCPHQDADLARGSVVGPALKCPLHGFLFESRTGRGMNCRLTTESRPAALLDGHWHVDGVPADVTP